MLLQSNWSAVNGKPLLELIKEKDNLKNIDLNKITDKVHNIGIHEIEKKGCTEFGIGTLIANLVRAIVHDQRMVISASVHLDGEYNQHDISASVPVVIGKNGIEEIIKVKLNKEETEAFNHSCDVIRSYLNKI